MLPKSVEILLKIKNTEDVTVCVFGKYWNMKIKFCGHFPALSAVTQMMPHTNPPTPHPPPPPKKLYLRIHQKHIPKNNICQN